MAKKPVQLRMVRPTRAVKTKYLTQRQQALLSMLRWMDRPMRIAEIQHRMSFQFSGSQERTEAYKNISPALSRLVRRGLVRRVRRGVYEAVAVRERKA